jgi:hypothetical protein
MGARHYIRIPGSDHHELPPLFVRTAESTHSQEVLARATELVEAEEMLPEFASNAEQRKFDLALNLVEQYLRFVASWQWGDSILTWTRQCEITFEAHQILRNLLHPDVWPHASRSSFVALLAEKSVPAPLPVEKAVGLRLTFRQPPPIDCFSDQFLFYLNSPVGDSAYHAWSHMNLGEAALLPPDRFHFRLIPLNMNED